MILSSHRLAAAALVFAMAIGTARGVTAQDRPTPHNVILFVADGLRSHLVDARTAPELQAVREAGVDFADSHSLFPTVTTPNASAIATGHRLGDTGDFGNSLYAGAPFDPPYASYVQPVEDDVAQALLNGRFGGDFLGRDSLARAAAAQGYQVAIVGKLGPTGVQDLKARAGDGVLLIDDASGYPAPDGAPLPPDLRAALSAAGLPTVAPDRGLNASSGAYNMAGVLVANTDQQNWFANVAAKVLLPRFKASGKPFLLIYWSRDPDGTQHNQGDSLNTLQPGINGPTTMAAVRNASENLGRLREAVKALGIETTTDIFVTADHGFSVESRQSQSSGAAKRTYVDVPKGFLPPGFLAIDMAQALHLTLFDAFGFPIDLREGAHPKSGALLGHTGADPQVVIAANGGADLIWLPHEDRSLAARIVAFLASEDYVGGVFVDDALGPLPGALPMSRIGMEGDARTPRPSIMVSFRSFGTGCADPEICGAEVGDVDLQQGQGIHGSFGRQDTHNFMAAIGPDFKAGWRDPAPVSNADIAPTLARILGVRLGGPGELKGRTLDEALAGGPPAPPAQPILVDSSKAPNGFFTRLKGEAVGVTTYDEAAGMPGRTIGLPRQ